MAISLYLFTILQVIFIFIFIFIFKPLVTVSFSY